MDDTRFKELGQTPCPVCDHKHRCKADPTRDRILCFRISDTECNGFRRIKSTGECSTYIRTGSPADRNGEAKQTRTKPTPASNETIRLLAHELGVSSESLRALELHEHKGYPAFPERDAMGTIIGFNVRYPDGKKQIKGGKRGLTYPTNLGEAEGPILIVEGASDVAACLTMGLAAVGRPSAKGGAQHLERLLYGREVLIVGENDAPGIEGAQLIAKRLSAAWRSPVSWALPPDGSKDVRAYLRSRTDVEPEHAGRELLEHLRATAETIAPEAVKAEAGGVSAVTLTDMRLAERLIAEHGQDLRYAAGSWWIWDGRRWKRDETFEAERRAKRMLRDLQKWAVDNVHDHDERKRLISAAMARERAGAISGILTLARAEPGVAIDINDLDSNPWLLNCQNGTLDLRTARLMPHRREHLITKVTSTEFDGDADCSRYLAFLNRIFEADKALIGYWRRLMGYCLTGTVAEHVLPIAHGRGANGKSTDTNVWLDILGDYAGPAAPKLLIDKRNEQHLCELADLRGKRFIACAESGEHGRLDEERVKVLTGGDEIAARFMRQDLFRFKPTHKLRLATNHRPIIRGSDHGIWRRIHLIPFNVVIPLDEQDHHLTDKLISEGPGLLAWAAGGCLEWQKVGLQPPPSVQAATEEYRVESDALGMFLAECCITAANARVGASNLYAAYKAWADQGGERVLTQTAFGRAMTERGFQKEACHNDGLRGRVSYFGVGLLPTEHPEWTQ